MAEASELHPDPLVGVAVLAERLGHVAEKLDALGGKLDAYMAQRDQVTLELDRRVAVLERQLLSVRYFLAGAAVAGGAIGGGITAMLGHMVGA